MYKCTTAQQRQAVWDPSQIKNMDGWTKLSALLAPRMLVLSSAPPPPAPPLSPLARLAVSLRREEEMNMIRAYSVVGSGRLTTAGRPCIHPGALALQKHAPQKVKPI